MTRSPTPGPDTPGPDALRKAGLRRALFATLALLGLAGSLWWVEDGDRATDPSAPTLLAAGKLSDANEPPAVAASDRTPSQDAPPGVPGSPETAPAADASPPAAASQDAGPDSRPPADPPAPVAGSSPPAPPATTPDSAGAPASPAECVPPVADSAANEDRPGAPPPGFVPAPAPGPGYLIQLGVFLDTANAAAMRQELERKGYPAHLQARVVLGPYPDRATALAAQEKVRRERKLDGMILPPRK